MVTVEKDIDRVLTLLRNKIRERNHTQLQVQDALGWGRSYISQLLTKQKSLRLEQVLKIIKVIGVTPSEFFGELYYFPQHLNEAARVAFGPGQAGAPDPGSFVLAGEGGASETATSYREVNALVRGLLRVLIERQVIQPEDLESAIQTAEGGPTLLRRDDDDD